MHTTFAKEIYALARHEHWQRSGAARMHGQQLFEFGMQTLDQLSEC
jgi:hypothetical protein